MPIPGPTIAAPAISGTSSVEHPLLHEPGRSTSSGSRKRTLGRKDPRNGVDRLAAMRLGQRRATLRIALANALASRCPAPAK